IRAPWLEEEVRHLVPARPDNSTAHDTENRVDLQSGTPAGPMNRGRDTPAAATDERNALQDRSSLHAYGGAAAGCRPRRRLWADGGAGADPSPALRLVMPARRGRKGLPRPAVPGQVDGRPQVEPGRAHQVPHGAGTRHLR